MKHLCLLFLPLLLISCADTWSEKKEDPEKKEKPVVKKEPKKQPLTPLPTPDLPTQGPITFVTPDTTSNLVTKQEKETVSPAEAPPERPELKKTSVDARPPATTDAPPAED